MPFDLHLPPLPPGSALRFNQEMAEKRFPSLLQNLEGEMSRLLEWASTGDAARQRARVNPDQGVTHTAEVRREEVQNFLKERADVHQRRAKRREIAESTAVRLPREIQAGRVRRGGTQREVSYLSDGQPAARPSGQVPASVIPDAFRIMMESPFPTREPHFYSLFGDEESWSYNSATRQFEAVLFPSKVPAGRRDVLLLHAWVNDMIARLKQTSSADHEEEMLKDAQLLFSVAFHEIIRQVSVHCLERGYLMGKIWWSEMELFQRLLQLYRRDRSSLEEERARSARERASMQGRIDELEREVERLRAEGNVRASPAAAGGTAGGVERMEHLRSRAEELAEGGRADVGRSDAFRRHGL